MLKPTDIQYPICKSDKMHGWEKKLIEWCFKNPEKEICGIYFNAIMNEDVRASIRCGSV